VIPQGFILDLLARVDIVEVVGRHVALKKGGQNYLGLCPFHGEKTPSFTVSPTKQFFHCFGCGAHGSAIGFLMDHRGLSYVEAIEDLAQGVGITVPKDVRGADEAAAGRGLADALRTAAEFYRARLRESAHAIEYLKGRGLTGAIAARYALGYAPDDWQALRAVFEKYTDQRLVDAGLVIVGEENKRYDRFRGRVMFPIRNRRGTVIGFGARVLDASEPKYLNSPETVLFHKGRELYGLYEAQEAIRRRSRVIVCEGYMDVIQLAQAGFGEAVAALGTAITAQHVATLFRLTGHVIFAFDGDGAGRKAARRALEATLPAIGDDRRASFVLLPEGEDPDSLIRAHGAGALDDQIAGALSLSQWFLRCVAEGLDLAQPEDRAAAVSAARPLLEAMPAGALRMQLVRALGEATLTPPQDLERLYGLSPWRRLPPPREGEARQLRTGPAVQSLKQQLLQRLLAFPSLAREFNAQIAALAVDGDADLDRQLAEVWRAGTSSASVHSGAVIEALAQSQYIESYQALVTRDLHGEDDEHLAKEELRAGFIAIEEERVRSEMDRLAGEDMPPEARERYRQLAAQMAELKRSRAAPPDAPSAPIGPRSHSSETGAA
jgi:DNA primase